MRIEIDTKCEETGALDALAGLLGDLVELRRAQDAQAEEERAMYEKRTADATPVPAPAPFLTQPLGELAAPSLLPTPPLPSVPTHVVPNRPPVSPNVPVGVELDVTGTPWDGRIHSVGKSKVANGTWRLRRGVDSDAVASIVTEHHLASVAPPPPPIGVPPVPAASVMSFGTLMQLITARTVSGEMTPGEMAAALREAGLPTIPVLATRPDLIGAAAHALGLAL